MRKLIGIILLSLSLLMPSITQAQSFVNTFGGSSVSPADVAYASYNFNTNLTLFWPQFTNGQPDVAARFMNMTAATTGLEVFMPDATLNSVGYDAIIFNAGSTTFNVVTFTGASIATIAPGQTYYLMLNSNTTQSGGWQTVQFGVGTGSASAAALAGPGLLAFAGMLQVNLSANIVSNSFALTSSALGMLYVWTGGSGVITLPSAASVGNGFFFMLANNGSGSVTLTPTGGNTIDGESTSVFSQTQSGFIMSNGTNWVTVGKGIQNTFAVTLLNLNVAGGTDVTETSAQAQNIIQQYIGLLTANINVIVPSTVQLYFVNNSTTGAFSLTVKTASGTGITVPQGSNAILYCDGTNVVNAFTASVSGSISLTPGSAVSPSLSFSGSPGTGLFSPTSNVFSATAGTTEVARFSSQASAVNYIGLQSSATSGSTNIYNNGTDANIAMSYITKGTGQHAFFTEGPLTGTPQIQFVVTDTASTVNALGVTGSATTVAPRLYATGSDTNIDVNVAPKGAGSLKTTNFNASGNALVGGTLGVTGTITGNLTGNVTGTVTGHSTLDLAKANNLSDVASVGTSRANLGLGTAAIQNTGTSGANVPLLNGTNVWTGSENMTGSTVTVATQSSTDNSTNAASTAFVQSVIGGTPIIKTITVQTLSSSGTYTPNAHLIYADVKIVGSGGCGGALASGNPSGGGGSAGSYAEVLETAAQIGSSQSVTVGTACTAASSGSGGSGATTSMGTLISCPGGNPGVGASSTSNSGGSSPFSCTVGTGTTIVSIAGQAGGYGAHSSLGISGYGGSNPLGFGGSSIAGPDTSTSVIGNSGSGFGAGSSGSVNNNTGASSPTGVVIITEYNSQ